MARVALIPPRFCAALALGNDLPRAVEVENIFTAAISSSYKVGKTFCAGKFLRPSQPEKLARVCRGKINWFCPKITVAADW